MRSSFDQLLENYAALAVEVGLNLQAGQRLLVRAPLQAAPLVRQIAIKAYQRGARLVDVQWGDDELTLVRFQHAPRDSFEEFPTWVTAALLDLAKNGGAVLSIAGSNPDLLQDQNPELIAAAQKTNARHMEPFYDYIMRDAINWSIIAMPVAAWAAKVYPDLPPAEQEVQLWEAIFEICRLKQEDPVAAWQAHMQDLIARSQYLNAKAYQALHFRGSGTDLTVGLPQGHRWKGAQSTSETGITFTPNLPTEEIFTLPHRDRVDGVVSASMPLSYGGALIEDFSLTFSDGRVTHLSARKGEAVLKNLVDTDEGAARLGEVALVPHNSPIAQRGMLFYNTLFDENAASHIALGRAYKFTMQNGSQMTDADFAAAGGNRSLVHVDFMIGSAEMMVDGLTADGRAEAVMRDGNWAFDI